MVLVVFQNPSDSKSSFLNALMDIGKFSYSDASWYAEQFISSGQVIIGRGEYNRLEPYRAAFEERGFTIEIQED